MSVRKSICALTAIGFLAAFAASAGATSYIEVATLPELAGGNPALTSHTMTVYAGGIAYSHVADTSDPKDFGITKTTFPGGVPTTATLTTLASWGADVGAPASDRIFTGYGSAVVGGSLQIVNSNNGDGEGVFRVDTTTGAVVEYLAEADITAALGTADPDIQNWSGVSPAGEAVFYEGRDDAILQTAGAGSVAVLVTSAQLAAAQGGSTLISSGLAYDNSGNLYWGNNTSDGLYQRDAGGVITELISAAALEGVVGAGSNSYSGDMFFAPDGLMYFRFGSSSTRSILSIDPAAADPEASLQMVISAADLLAGPGANSSVGELSWYDGNIAWSTFTGGYYAIPEPATMALLGLGGLLVTRRRR